MIRSTFPAVCCAFLLVLAYPAAGNAQFDAGLSIDAELNDTSGDDWEVDTNRRRAGDRIHRSLESGWMRRVIEPGEVTGIAEGFVCVDGTLLSAPYSVKWEANQFSVNGIVIQGPIHHSGERIQVDEIALELEAGSALWADHGDNYLLSYGCGLTEFALLFSQQRGGTEIPHEALRDFLDYIRQSGEESVFMERWGAAEVPTDVASRLQAIVATVHALEQEAAHTRAATARLDTLAYPLTVFGMLMCVLAVGHLLAYPPFGFNAILISADSPIALQAVIRSLALIAVLSCLDLLWTMLASQAGQMRELNPLGARVISDPSTLITFKFLATGVGVSLLFFIRRNHSAQVASWWMCMVLVLLSMRWVAFNSMFVA